MVFNSLFISNNILRFRFTQLLHDQLPSGNRFWIEKIKFTNHTDSLLDKEPIELLKTNIKSSCLDITKMEVGIALLPKQGKLVPIHNGQFQEQHSSYFSVDDDSLICGFFPRASHVINSDSDNTNGDRPMDEGRFHALNKALTVNYGIDKDEIVSDKYIGSPPSRIYRSFVYPRSPPNYLLDPIDKAANRTASQIDMALRQVRADEASYLRNTDKEVVSTRELQGVAFLLDNLRSAHNVGSIFRTSETGKAYTVCMCP